MKLKYLLILVLFCLFNTLQSKAQELTSVYPKNDYITADTSITFTWNKYHAAINYTFHLATDASFTQIIKTIDNITSNQVFVNELSHGTYYWRVKANFSVGNPIFGNVYKISIFCPKDIAGLLLWLDSDTAVITHNDTVAEWKDLSLNKNNALQSSPNMQPVKIKNIALLNYKSSIKFDGNDDFMSFNDISNIRTAFLIVKHKTGIQDVAPILGHPTLYNWHGGNQEKLFLGGNVSSFIVNGSCFQNGQNIPALSINKPKTYTILSFITTDNVSAQYITNDRNAGRIWDGNYSNIIIYSFPLTSNEHSWVLQYLQYKYFPPVNLGFDINIPYGFCDITLTVDSCFSHYIWNTGNPSDTLSTLTIKNGGIYSVTATDIFGFNSTDTIVINRPSLIINDTTICQFSSATINSHLNHDYTFLWSTTETDSFITVSNAGKYWLKVSDTLGCSITDTFYVSIDSFPSKVSLGPDISVCTGDSIRLVWGVQQAVTYLWNDNSTNPYLVINNPGTYWVTVTDSNNCIASDTIIVGIKGPLPSTNFISDSVCLGGLTHFTDLSSIPSPYTITEWHWNFGDGYFSDIQNPIHQYASSGIFNVSLRTVSNVGCTRTIVKQVYVYSIPVADLIPLNGCNNVPIQFHDISNNQMGNITSWHWNFGDPGSGVNNESDLKDPVHTYLTSGNYNITLIVASEAGCLDTITRIINIRQSADVDFSFTEVCIENAVYFTDETLTPIYNSIISWHWDFGDGDSSSNTNPSHLYDTAGTYQATLTVKTLNGCEVSISKPVTVYAKPIPDFVLSDICALVPYQFFDFSSVQNSFITKWEWQIISLDTQYVQNPVFTFPLAGAYNVKLIVTTQAGCKDSISKQVSVFDSPEANFNFSPKYGIAPLTVNFTNYTTGGSSFLWNFGDESGTSILKNPSYTYTENGIYNIKLISYNQNNCYDSIIKQIKIIPSSLDIAVKEVKTTVSNNYLDISADLINLGTRTIEELYLFIESNQGNNIRETWTGVLESGNQLHYKFSAEIPISEQTIDYICVRTSIPDFPVDDNPANDKKCKALVEDFILIDPYPNPTNGILNVAYILPLTNDVDLCLYNSTGALIKKLFSGEGLKGYNINTFDFSKLAKGMYAIQIKYRDKVKVVKFVKE